MPVLRRWPWISPAWDPPRRLSTLIVRLMEAASRSSSRSCRERHGLRGSRPALHRISSHNKLPSPEIFCWLSKRALRVALLFLSDTPSCWREILAASGPNFVSSGCSSMLPKPLGSTIANSLPCAKFMTNRMWFRWTFGVVYSNRSIGVSPSTTRRPVIPNRKPRELSPMSSMSSFPLRRTWFRFWLWVADRRASSPCVPFR